MQGCLQFLRPCTLASSRPISRTSRAAYARFFSAVQNGSKTERLLEAAPLVPVTAERLRQLGTPKTKLYPRITPRDRRMDVRAFTETFGTLKASEFAYLAEEVVLRGIIHQPLESLKLRRFRKSKLYPSGWVEARFFRSTSERALRARALQPSCAL